VHVAGTTAKWQSGRGSIYTIATEAKLITGSIAGKRERPRPPPNGTQLVGASTQVHCLPSGQQPHDAAFAATCRACAVPAEVALRVELADRF
jgi:hypothetical protein